MYIFGKSYIVSILMNYWFKLLLFLFLFCILSLKKFFQGPIHISTFLFLFYCTWSQVAPDTTLMQSTLKKWKKFAQKQQGNSAEVDNNALSVKNSGQKKSFINTFRMVIIRNFTHYISHPTAFRTPDLFIPHKQFYTQFLL